MSECCEIFAETINEYYFGNCSIVLLLNKDDLLREQLRKKDNGLSQCFCPNRWPNEQEFWDTNVNYKHLFFQFYFFFSPTLHFFDVFTGYVSF